MKETANLKFIGGKATSCPALPGKVMRTFWILGLLVFISAVAVRAEVPNGPWAVSAMVVGAGVRYTPVPRWSVEGRTFFGEGMAVSLRGSAHFPHPTWKVRPLAGIEASLLTTVNGEGARGEAVALFVGGEVRLTGRMTLQVDMGPALLRVAEKGASAKSWDYQNVLNLGVNYYFGGAKK